MSQDLFADLLSGSKKKPNNDSNISLAQKLEQSRNGSSYGVNNNSGSNWASNLDLLDQLSSRPASSLGSPATPKGQNGSFDLFSSFSSAADVTQSKRMTQNGNSSVLTNNSNLNINSNNSTNNKSSDKTLDLLDDFFSTPPVQPAPKIEQTSPSVSNSSDRIAGSANDNSTTSSAGKQAAVKPPPASESDLKDEALAELIDMGFPIERANAALDSTESGHDINGAISYLMNEAHAKTRPAQHTSRSNSHYSEHGDQEDLGAMVSDLSTEFMNKASLFFNTGRKKLQEGLDMYKQQQFEKSNNQPAWMRNQEKYKANSMHLPGDEDEEEMDPETMRRLVEQQRLKEKKLRAEKERAIKEDLLKRQHEASMQRQQQHQSSVFDAPKPRRRPASRTSSTASSSRQHTPVPSSSGSQHNSPSASTTSSPSTASTRPHVAQPQPTKAKRADEALLDMLNAPIVTKTPPPSRLDRLRNSNVDSEQVYTSSKRRGASNRSRTSTPASSSSSSVKLPQVPISDAQKSRFISARTEANDLFKKGDFPRALELFETSLSALPSGHPFQIIAYSNLATVYSKTGNSKLQLESADKGLALIRSISENVKELDSVTIEDDKSVKSFWVKLVSRKAESLEHLEKYQDALAAYNLLIENGSASKPIMDGRRRYLPRRYKTMRMFKE
ncbi:unnamed protein product [Ambrosiozyma monospora]|uniref:Unnamed protein product n=1 Tax=Ambrosiozyma monospora TaxID=43982 RepID=A0ACB5SUB6_AMBMO|nr:unnamed protein product [Ambrosiozyma monospora]